MTQQTLIYVHDPLCGWCYAVAPLMKAASQLPDLQIKLFAGGLFIGDNRQQLSKLKSYIMPHDQRIAAMTGQVYSDEYFNGLLNDPTVILDSAIPMAAIIAVDRLSGKALEMQHRIQHAHYAEAKKVMDPSVLADLAVELGIDRAEFEAEMAKVDETALVQEINQAHQWLQRLGGRGFPTLGLQIGDEIYALPVSEYLGQVDKWLAMLASKLPAKAESSDLPFCSPDGCTPVAE
ncbi:DsbA family protein [Leeia sp. TBRC 13508]|uniref:DsbA family protein n=1 Tax=Leeia speluncae TaxID=2884804 RepID=A0ABS8D9K6_9NEIS|nr:DsbA family protein [Leeia speluncae]MCB6184896.1 DsbA family protein [Leeia speluncae]